MAGLLAPGPTLAMAEELRKQRGSRGLLGAVGEPMAYAPNPVVAALGQGLLGAQYLTGEKEMGQGLANLSNMTAMMIGSRVPAPIRNIIGWHGSQSPIDAFDFKKSKDGGVHFGTKEQAEMRGRSGGSLIEADVDIKKPMRSRDTGGDWKDKIRNAKSKGYDGIMYLNRYEGMSLDDIQRAQAAGVDLDRLTDAQFRKFVPNAKDSFIAFSPEQIKILQNIKK